MGKTQIRRQPHNLLFRAAGRSLIRNVRSIAVLAFIALSWLDANALEFEPFLGNLNYQRLDGCCYSSGNRIGSGVLVRLDTKSSGEWDFIGYSDTRWSEFSVHKPTYWIGDSSPLDPSPDPSTSVRRLKTWKVIGSYGGGFFSHSTRTVKFDLPAISSGFTANGQMALVYTINDKWALTGTLRIGLSFAADDRGFLTGTFLGLNYRP